MDNESLKNYKHGNLSLFLKIFIVFILLTILIAYFSTYPEGMTRFSGVDMPVIHSDGARYYSYIISYIILKDFSFNKSIDEYYTGEIRGFIYYSNTGNYLPKSTIGVAIMALPFFLIAYLLSMIFGYPLDGTSLLFQHAFGLSGIFYGFLGIIILIKILKKFFSDKVIALSIIAVVFGTNLFHYLTLDSGFSHSFSFFLFALWIFILIKWYDNPKAYKYPIFLGLILGLITLVRLTNIIVVFILIFYGIVDFKSLKERIFFFKKNLSRIAIIIIVFLLSFLPQLIVWRIGSGSWFINYYHSYRDLELFSFPPHIIEVLFSVRAGLFFWSPILIFSIIGFYYLKKKDNGLFFPILIFSIFNLFVIASTTIWWYGGSFGHRGFVESYAFLIFPLAYFYSSLSSKKIKTIVLIFTFLFIAYSLLQMYLYWESKIPAGNVTFQVYIDKFVNLYKKLSNLF